MAGLKINTGTIRLEIDDDPGRVISFCPTDVRFAERVQGLISELQGKQKEFESRVKALNDTAEMDENGVPLNIGDQLAMARELIEYMRGKIDEVFGAGTSQTAFGDCYSFEALVSFFEGVAPYIAKARGQKIDAHLRKVRSRK